jgi:pyruvate/2-oxoglutarate dehydrogenase complex dihydrolipoamide acyltransferase (E2) component
VIEAWTSRESERLDRGKTVEGEDETGFTMRLAAVILPDLGTGPNVPIVVSHWFVARGGRVWAGERLVEVLVGPTATFDVSSPVSGRLAEIREREDEHVRAGSVLGLVATNEEVGPEQKQDCQIGRHGDEPPSSQPRA